MSKSASGGIDTALRLSPIANCLVVGAVLVVVAAGTHRSTAAAWGWLIGPFLWAATAFFGADLLMRIKQAMNQRGGSGGGIVVYLKTPAAWVDVLAVLALPVPVLIGLESDTARLFALLCVPKLGRYSHGLSLLGRVVRNAADPLLSVLLSFAIILIFAATLLYLVEGDGQPEQFGSIPSAMWWAIVTLTTTGYGDAIPVSLPGRVLGGLVMICGIGVFALWAGILASGFADELRRRDFLRTWELVAKVPFFGKIGAGVIAEVAHLLRRREVSTGQTVLREGKPGESMFFIVSGEVEVRTQAGPVRLGDNQFFGEMALVSGAPRTASVVATQPCVLLELDVADFRELAGSRPELMKVITEEAERRAGASSP